MGCGALGSLNMGCSALGMVYDILVKQDGLPPSRLG